MPTTPSLASQMKSVGFICTLPTLWLLVVVGCGGGEQGSSKEEGAPPVTGSFVGVAPDAAPQAEAFVALVASGTEDEGEAQRQVRAYLCDGQSINEWFNEGSVEGNELNLTSEGGARLEGSLATEAATGTITLDDRESFTFTADLASNVSGLFDVNVSEEGDLRGTSENDGRLKGMLAHQLGEDGLYPVSSIFTAPDAERLELVVLSAVHETDEYRSIVLPDGEVRGGPKGGGGEGFIEQDVGI